MEQVKATHTHQNGQLTFKNKLLPITVRLKEYKNVYCLSKHEMYGLVFTVTKFR